MQRQQTTAETNTTEKSESRGSLSDEITTPGFSSSLKFPTHCSQISHKKYQIRVRCSMSSSSNTQTSCNEDQKSNSNQSPHTIFTDVEKEKLCETQLQSL